MNSELGIQPHGPRAGSCLQALEKPHPDWGAPKEAGELFPRSPGILVKPSKLICLAFSEAYLYPRVSNMSEGPPVCLQDCKSLDCACFCLHCQLSGAVLVLALCVGSKEHGTGATRMQGNINYPTEYACIPSLGAKCVCAWVEVTDGELGACISWQALRSK